MDGQLPEATTYSQWIKKQSAARQDEALGRSRAELMGWIAQAGLQVLGRLDAKPRHSKASNTSDPLHSARSAEVTSLWRLGVAGP